MTGFIKLVLTGVIINLVRSSSVSRQRAGWSPPPGNPKAQYELLFYTNSSMFVVDQETRRMPCHEQCRVNPHMAIPEGKCLELTQLLDICLSEGIQGVYLHSITRF